MLCAELKGISSDDYADDWKVWRPTSEADFIHHFTLSIGVKGKAESDLFQTAVASRSALKGRTHIRRAFKGFVLEKYDPLVVEEILRDFVENTGGWDWSDIVTRLSEKMLWEYDGMAGDLNDPPAKK
jgi:hypothetical protein